MSEPSDRLRLLRLGVNPASKAWLLGGDLTCAGCVWLERLAPTSLRYRCAEPSNFPAGPRCFPSWPACVLRREHLPE